MFGENCIPKTDQRINPKIVYHWSAKCIFSLNVVYLEIRNFENKKEGKKKKPFFKNKTSKTACESDTFNGISINGDVLWEIFSVP